MILTSRLISATRFRFEYYDVHIKCSGSPLTISEPIVTSFRLPQARTKPSHFLALIYVPLRHKKSVLTVEAESAHSIPMTPRGPGSHTSPSVLNLSLLFVYIHSRLDRSYTRISQLGVLGTWCIPLRIKHQRHLEGSAHVSSSTSTHVLEYFSILRKLELRSDTARLE